MYSINQMQTSNSHNRQLYLLSLPLLISWSLYFCIYILSPLTISGSRHLAIIHSLYYVAIATFIALFASWAMRNTPAISLETHPLSNNVRWFFILLGLFGLCAHIYDKFYIRAYVYDACRGGIREAWLQDGAARMGAISSPYSALGHILSYAGIIPLFDLTLSASLKRNWQIFFQSIIGMVIIVIYAISLGSRSVLIYLALIVGALFYTRKIFVKNSLSLKQVVQEFLPILGFISILSLIFAAYFFQKRIYCTATPSGYVAGNLASHGFLFKKAGSTSATADAPGDVSLSDQITGGLGYIINNLREGFSQDPSGAWGDNIPLMAQLYLLNGTASYEHLLAYDAIPQNPYRFFDFIFNYLHKFNLSPDIGDIKTKYYPQGLLSYPGHVYHAYGSVGIYLVSIVQALLTILMLLLLKFKYANKAVLVLVPHLLVVLVLSPIVFSVKLMAFPFLFFYSIVYVLLTRTRAEIPKT